MVLPDSLDYAECKSMHLCLSKICYEQLPFSTELHYRNIVSGILHLEEHVVLTYEQLQDLLNQVKKRYPNLK